MLPKYQAWDYEIFIEERRISIFGLIYQLSEMELSVLKQYIDDNFEKGFIRLLISSCTSPVLFVPKKDDILRLCVDFR